MLLRFAFEHLTAYWGAINEVQTKLCTLTQDNVFKLDAILENSIPKKSPTFMTNLTKGLILEKVGEIKFFRDVVVT